MILYKGYVRNTKDLNMNTFDEYYIRNLYPIQDGIIRIVNSLHTPFYLTGGTALSRGYCNHRYSDDLDFFVNNEKDFLLYINQIVKKIKKGAQEYGFEYDNNKLILTDDFAQLFIKKNDTVLKVDFINDIPENYGSKQNHSKLGKIDSVDNILTNKITALFRHEPKDIVDIWSIATKYNFNWETAINLAKDKEIGIDPIIISEIIDTFPADRLNYIKWIGTPDKTRIMEELKTIVEEILQSKDNSLPISGNKLF